MSSNTGGIIKVRKSIKIKHLNYDYDIQNPVEISVKQESKENSSKFQERARRSSSSKEDTIQHEKNVNVKKAIMKPKEQLVEKIDNIKTIIPSIIPPVFEDITKVRKSRKINYLNDYHNIKNSVGISLKQELKEKAALFQERTRRRNSSKGKENSDQDKIQHEKNVNVKKAITKHKEQIVDKIDAKETIIPSIIPPVFEDITKVRKSRKINYLNGDHNIINPVVISFEQELKEKAALFQERTRSRISLNIKETSDQYTTKHDKNVNVKKEIMKPKEQIIDTIDDNKTIIPSIIPPVFEEIRKVGKSRKINYLNGDHNIKNPVVISFEQELKEKADLFQEKSRRRISLNINETSNKDKIKHGKNVPVKKEMTKPNKQIIGQKVGKSRKINYSNDDNNIKNPVGISFEQELEEKMASYQERARRRNSSKVKENSNNVLKDKNIVHVKKDQKYISSSSLYPKRTLKQDESEHFITLKKKINERQTCKKNDDLVIFSRKESTNSKENLFDSSQRKHPSFQRKAKTAIENKVNQQPKPQNMGVRELIRFYENQNKQPSLKEMQSKTSEDARSGSVMEHVQKYERTQGNSLRRKDENKNPNVNDEKGTNKENNLSLNARKESVKNCIDKI